ncbi:GGDEF domain-containing protein [Vibrio owensii]|uniref:GGDEF domain-containing protein n=1 Tax=Vibrio owensii TaxID=696485 RepID=UPI0013CEAE7E|nr:GGDEF domain-containing protein [Vibrio owensii]
MKLHVFLLSKLISSIYGSEITDFDVNKYDNFNNIYSNDIDIYSTSYGPKVVDQFDEIFTYSHGLLEAQDDLIIKFFDSETLLSNNPISYFEEGGNVSDYLSNSYCMNNFVSTICASKSNAEDGIIFSNPLIYNDKGEQSVVITAPVYHANELVAEVSLDVRLHLWGAMKNKKLRFERQDEYLNMFIFDDVPIRNFMVWSRVMKVDNYATITYQYSYVKVLVDSVLVLFISIVSSTIFYLYFVEKKHHAHTKRYSMIDSLTGCYNRKVYESKTFKKLVGMYEINSVITFDGNKIKQINDLYGHDIGDLAISLIADTLKAHFRKTDFVVRVGGDEFVVIAPGLPGYIASELVQEIKEVLFNTRVIDNLFVSVSCGISEFSSLSEFYTAIKKADLDLYKDKARTSA